MARLKKTNTREPTPPTAPEPLPEHVRTREWNGIKAGDRVIVRQTGKRAKRGFRYWFSAHVVSPGGKEYIDVLECRLGETNGLWRSFNPDEVFPILKK
jgi:hypothetical protein